MKSEHPPYKPEPRRRDGARRQFTRGKRAPRGIAWFGVSAFSGHLRHFAASAIATEDVDSRDWMQGDEPRALMQRVLRRLGASGSGTGGGESITQSLGRDLWIDYVADTGDDVSVSEAVARLIFAPYTLPEPRAADATVAAPRGDILIFGGDTAYPVATAQEIESRVVEPFNRVLEERRDDRPRVLMGIPGNHDWYDGLDGFGRLFRRRRSDDAPRAGTRPGTRGAKRWRTMTHYAEWAVEFVRGGSVHKQGALVLEGYQPVQNASYFCLPLAPGVAMLAVDRQLTHLDFRQVEHFRSWLNRHLSLAPWVLLPDPVYHFGEASPSGTKMIESLGLHLGARPHLVLAGDIHHYRREQSGKSLLVTAGGGGAFLHPAPLRSQQTVPARVAWPDAAQSKRLLWGVPFRIAFGGAGILPHLALMAMFSPYLVVDPLHSGEIGRAGLAPLGIWIVTTLVYSLLGGLQQGRLVSVIPAAIAGALTASLPLLASILLHGAFGALGAQLPSWSLVILALLAAALVGAFVFGAYLALMTRLGWESTQAFTALGHPGFKHFVRFRVRADGSAVDAWVLGLEDPLAPGEKPVLVDHFSWPTR